jgi:hypothetical protein
MGPWALGGPESEDNTAPSVAQSVPMIFARTVE